MGILLIVAKLLGPVLIAGAELRHEAAALEAAAEANFEAKADAAEASSVAAAVAAHLFALIAKLGDLFPDQGLKVDLEELPTMYGL